MKKEDLIAQNTHGGLDLDADIYRIFRVDHLLNDISSSTLTLVNPCFNTQWDDLENPLKEQEYDVDGSSYKLFKQIMSEYYSQSWSSSEIDFGNFGEGCDVVRVRTKARKLFQNLMDEKDQFCSLYYHLGKITYEDPKIIRENINSTHYADHLDSQGFGLLRAMLMLRADFHKEDEVRLVYIRSPREGYDTPNQHPVSGKNDELCAHAFDWKGIIDDYEFKSDRHKHDGLIAAINGNSLASSLAT